MHLPLLALLLITCNLTISAHARDDILIIHSYHNEHIWTGFLKQGFDESFSDYSKTRVFHEFLDAKRFPTNEFKSSFLKYLQNKYSQTKLSVIAVTDDPAMQFIRDNRRHLFPNVPIIFLGINKVSNEILNTKNMTGVFENRDLAKTVIDIKAITELDELIVISDSTSTGKANLEKITSILGSDEAPSKIHVIEDLSVINIHSVLQPFPNNIPIFLIGQLINPQSNNELLSWNYSTEQVSQQTPKPIFTIAITTLDFGATGADELNGIQHAKQASGLIKKVLSKTPINEIEPITKAKSQWFFDDSKLRQYHIEKTILPRDAILLNTDKSFYEEYKSIVWIVGSAFITFILIIILLSEIIRRGVLTRKILQENEQRYKDLASVDANIFWETDTLNNINYVSGDSLLPFNHTPSQMIGKSIRDLVKQKFILDFPLSNYKNAVANQEELENLIFKVKQKNNEVKIFQIKGRPIYDSNQHNFIGYRGICKEITEKHHLTERLTYQASYDSLTNLINRSTFNNKLKQYTQKESQQHEKVFLCFLDLDRFKLVNDTVGHLVGDSMLIEVSNIIKNSLNDNDVLGRLGGDEFGALIFSNSQSEAQTVCEKIIKSISHYKFTWHDRAFDIGVSIGMVEVSGEFNETELLSKADLSCYKAKELGRGRVFIADKHNNDLFNEAAQIGYIANISQAIERNQFFLVKQIISSLQEDGFTQNYYEILLRFNNREGIAISPGLFIPAAEKHGVITLIDQWVITTVLSRYTEFFPDKNTRVSINLSGISLSNKDFIKHIIHLVKSSTIKPQNICFEITETAVISQMARAISFITEMKSYGIQFSLDDFGSGESSFAYLKNLPVDYLKIDGSLITQVASDPIDYAIVKSIHSIAKMMNMKTVAEYVENDEIKAVLKEIGIDYAQGYGIGKPLNCINK
ncbi:EAL domain-containing protein [Marinomonas sp. 15G1-11]|uniref:EAL domain-containing protein n=1 Tax=Marinomonas phaeophyticola TaxID=3004091 RepID=A0ABT4JTM4_9GAMM|nr:EAL domain-containing protein [Marinomonas sp. 15G1-11]MCZ2721752.1 EAL domain-containing protein [Marinomonas sp. 15G1-11]